MQTKIKKPIRKKIIGGLRKFISMQHVNDVKRDNHDSALDAFIDYVHERFHSSKYFYDFGKYQIEISCNISKLIIALHDRYEKHIEYMHITCFKSTKKYKSYAHLTFNGKNKLRIYYNNDHILSLGDLIKICEEIYYYIFNKTEEHSLIQNESWKKYWRPIFYVFIGSLYALDKNDNIFPKAFSTKESRKVLGIRNVEVSPQKQKLSVISPSVKVHSPSQTTRNTVARRLNVSSSAPAKSFR
jgi:hypothetical protein